MDPRNPFHDAAAEGIGEAALRELEAARQHQAWLAHVEACRAIMKHGVLARLELAAEAARQWGHETEVTGIYDTATCTGVLHLRAKLLLSFPGHRHSRLEFIASPKSHVIACEAERSTGRKRWKKIALSAEAISSQADTVIREFLKWGVQ